MCFTYANKGTIPQGYLQFQDTDGQNFNGYIHVFEVHMFNRVVDDITGNRVIPEIVYSGLKTAIFLLPVYSHVQTA